MNTDTPQHTPGPWSAIPPISNVLIGLSPHTVYPIIGDTNNPVEDTGVAACILPNEDDTEETRHYMMANARLIAAAPDLLECLKQAVKDEERGRNVIAEVNREMGFDEPKKLLWVQHAEAAILKATHP